MKYNPFRKVKNYKEYNENQINDLIKQAGKSTYYYDYLIDRLYFYGDDKRKENVLTVRALFDREKKEIKINENFMNLCT